MSQPVLEGIRVLELGDGVAAPYSGKLLADLGADVVKAEPPGGDSSRRYGPFPGGAAHPERSGIFLYLNAGKRGIVLDPKQTADRDLLARLVADVDVVLESFAPGTLDRLGVGFDALRRHNPYLVLVSVTPFGQDGPRASWRGSDLITSHGSGFAYVFPSHQVDRPDQPPLNAPGRAVDLLAGEIVTVAVLHGLLAVQETGQAVHLDVSLQEAVAAENHHRYNVVDRSGSVRRTFSAGPQGGSVGLLPCQDGWVAISPREEDQWARWLEVLGNPAWGSDPRFADKGGREKHWGDLHPLLAAWSQQRTRHAAFETAQRYRIACLPLGTGPDLLESAQLEARGFLQHVEDAEVGAFTMPGAPYQVSGLERRRPRRAPRLGEHQDEVIAGIGRPRAVRDPAVALMAPTRAKVGISMPAGAGASPAAAVADRPGLSGRAAARLLQPLAGARVVDFSWVMGGPICTKYLAALGAEVFKIESRSRPDTSHRDAAWEELNPGKQSVTLNLKHEEAREIARQLIAQSDIVVENFSTGVMERLGLGYETLRARNPGVIMASLSSFGRTGPSRDRRAYGTLIQCFTGWAGLAAHPGLPPRTSGGVWTDPLSAILLTSLVLAAYWRQRETGEGCAIDLSMVEATVAALPEPILAWSMNREMTEPRGNRDQVFAPQGCYSAAGDDAWVALSVQSDDQWQALCRLIGRDDLGAEAALTTAAGRHVQHDRIDEAISAWTRQRLGLDSARLLQEAGIPAAPTMNPADVPHDEHLQARELFDPVECLNGGERLAPRVPWRINGVRPAQVGRPPHPGEHTEQVLRDVLGVGEAELARLAREQVIW